MMNTIGSEDTMVFRIDPVGFFMTKYAVSVLHCPNLVIAWKVLELIHVDLTMGYAPLSYGNLTDQWMEWGTHVSDNQICMSKVTSI